MFIEFKDVSFKYYGSDEYVFNQLSFAIEKGSMLAILGHNGSGKSTIAKLMMGLLETTSGDIYIEGEKLTEDNVDVLRKKMGIIFQNPDNQFVGVTVRDDIAFGLENHKIPRKEMIEKIDKYAKLVNMQDFLDENPENLSGGQKQRVAIAGALAMDTDLIIFDESTSALDVLTQKKIIDLIIKLQKEKNITIGLVCHDIHLVSQISDKVAVMYLGNLVEVIPGRKLQEQCKHPYTQTLISSTFHLNMNYSKKIENIKEAENPIDISKGCPFKNRCKYSMEICKDKKPELKLVSKNHYVACHLNNGEEE